jgi:hypothetical protein
MSASSKILKRVVLPLGVTGLGLYSTGYLEDAYYLLGGFYRGMRCAKTGGQVIYAYVKVSI